MAWVKSSDTAAQHPIVIAPLIWSVDDLDGLHPLDMVSILFGLAWRCATHSAQQGNDYNVPDQVVALMAGSRWRIRAEQAEKAGYWSRNEADDGYTLVDDAEHLFHIRRKAEIEWENLRRADVSNPALVVPVRLRDGDGCRYCGVIVQWGARRGNRRGTYDHRNPGRPALSPDDLVVACGACNSTRGRNLDLNAWPLRPVPADPYYGSDSVDLLHKYGQHVRPSDPASRGIPHRDPAPSGSTPLERSASRAHAVAEQLEDQLLPMPKSAESADRRHSQVRNPGRDGDGSGRAGAGRRGRRSRRGGRGSDPDGGR